MSSIIEKIIDPYEEEWKNLKHGYDMSYVLKKGMKIYPHPLNQSQYVIRIEYMGQTQDYSEETENPFGDEPIYLPVKYKKKKRYKKDRDIWKEIYGLYKHYYIKFRKQEDNES